MQGSFLHPVPSFRISDYGKYVCVEASGLSMRMCTPFKCWRQDLASSKSARFLFFHSLQGDDAIKPSGSILSGSLD